MGFVQELPIAVTRRMRVGAGLVVVLLVAAGVLWVRSSRPNLDPDTTSRTAGGVTVLLYTEDFEGDVAAVGYSSTLRLVEDRCLGLDGPNGPEIAVFPRGTTVSADDAGVAVRVPGAAGARGATLRPGDAISFGAITAPTPVSDFGGHLADHTPRACRDFNALGLTDVSQD